MDRSRGSRGRCRMSLRCGRNSGRLRNHKREPTGESLTEDDHRRPQTTMEGLTKLRPAFGKSGTVTAGNASGIVDGAAAVVVMSLEEVRKRNMSPLGRIVSWGVAGVEPKLMGRG